MVAAVIKIKSLSGSFSAAQKHLADYIVANSSEVPFLSVRELAQEAGVSTASVSRFARTIGYKSFRDFKIQIGKDSLSPVSSIYRAISRRDSDEDIIDKVFSGNVRSLEETLKMLNRADLIRSAGVISRCNRLVFFGIGSSGNIANDAALRFSQLDVQSEAYNDSYQMLNQSVRMKKGDVAFGISHTGRSSMTVQALRMASRGGATTMGIANYLKSPLHDASDLFLCTSFPESRVKVAAISSRIAQMCLIDALYLLVARHRRFQLSNTERLNDHAEKLLRVRRK